MASMLATLLVASFVAPPVGEANRLDELFRSWQHSQGEVQSLVVQFRLKSLDRAFGTTTESDGLLKLLRTRKGEFLASYEVTQRKPAVKDDVRGRWLLTPTAGYLLVHDSKNGIRFDLPRRDRVEALAKHFSPTLILLSRANAEKTCQLEIVKQDRWYTYVKAIPRGTRGEELFREYPSCRVVFNNKASKKIPKDMPVQIWHQDRVGNESTFTITSWRLNGPDAPKVGEFNRPEDRAGWKVADWPSWKIKASK